MQLPKVSLPKLKTLWPKGQKGRGDVFVVVDIGSSMVRAAVVEMGDRQISVLSKAELPQEPGAMWGGMIGNLDTLVTTMEEVLNRAMTQSGVETEQMVLGLGGSLVGGVTTLAHVNRPDPRQKVDDKELALMLQQVAQSALGDAETDASEQMALPKDSLRLVNSGLTSINLDGYTLASPVGFSGKEVEIGLFNAFVSDSTLVALQKMLADLNVDLTALASEPYALAQALVFSGSKPQQVSALLIDVGAGSSSVTLVQQGVVTGSATFPVGGRSVTAAIAQLLSVPADEAEHIKQEFAAGKAGEAQRHKLQRAVEREIGVWLKAFKMSLISLEPQGAMPEIVYLTGGGSQLPELTKELERFGWERVGFAAQPAIKRLTLAQFTQLVDLSHALGDEDVTLASLALLLSRQYTEDPRVAELFNKTLRAYTAT
jgi:cell division protein FtsA